MKGLEYMKKLIRNILMTCLICSILSGIFLLTGCGDSNSVDKTLKDTDISNMVGKDMDGNVLDSSVFSKNKITMANIWGTFCGPCIKEMPDLQKLSDNYKDKGFQIIGMPVDIYNNSAEIKNDKYSEAKQILSQTGVKYPQLIADKTFYESVLKSIQNVPVTIFINSDGKQIGVQYMGSKTYDEWVNIIGNLLE